jgi:hypothetical protein
MSEHQDADPSASEDVGKVARFLIPPEFPQIVSFDFNTLLSYGQLTPEFLHQLTGLLEVLQKSVLDAKAGDGFSTFDAPECTSHGPSCEGHCGLGGCPPQCIHHFPKTLVP